MYGDMLKLVEEWRDKSHTVAENAYLTKIRIERISLLRDLCQDELREELRL
jgi:hypothetical protein